MYTPRSLKAESPHRRSLPEYKSILSSDSLKAIFSDCGDFEARELSFGLRGGIKITACWLDGIVSGSEVTEGIIRPFTELLRSAGVQTEQDCISQVMSGAVYSHSAKRRDKLDDVVDALTHGFCALIFDGASQAVCFEVKTSNTRSVSEPTLEKSIKGAKDSFVETLRTNTALVRKRICSPKLKVIESSIGRKSHTKLAIMFVDGVASPDTVRELASRLDALDVDALLATGTLEEYIVDAPRSPFPQLLHTERPDRFAMYLMDGRVGILIDGLPIGLALPVTLAEFMKVTGDASNNYLVATVLTVLRYFALFLSIFLPALYVAIAMYHQEMIPTPLLLSIIEAKQNVPFSTALEIMGMLISFELLQEAGLRLPNPIGDTVSIIGALIVGQSAVEAQVVSPIAIIVVAVSGIAGYTLPSQDFGSAIRLLRFVLVIASILAGFFGVGAALCLLTLHLADIDSFGVDYTAPLSDGEPSPLRRLLLQKPKPLNKFRDPHLKTPDKRRQK